MKYVERNLGLHQNETYYSILGGVPCTLRTKQISEARCLLWMRREREVVESTDIPAGALTVTAESAGQAVRAASTSNDELAEIKAILANLITQVAQLAYNAPHPASGGAIPAFKVFWNHNLGTVRATVAKKSQKMYDGKVGRFLRTLQLYQRFERFRAFKATGVPAEVPDLLYPLGTPFPAERSLSRVREPLQNRRNFFTLCGAMPRSLFRGWSVLGNSLTDITVKQQSRKEGWIWVWGSAFNRS